MTPATLAHLAGERPWQPKVVARTVDSLSNGYKVIYNAPTGSGKTLVALQCAHQLISRGRFEDAYLIPRTINEFGPYERDLTKFGFNLELSYRVGKRKTCPFLSLSEDGEGSTAECNGCLGENQQDQLSTPRRIKDSAEISRLLSVEKVPIGDLIQRYARQDLGTGSVCLHQSLLEIKDSNHSWHISLLIFGKIARQGRNRRRKSVEISCCS
jgi:Type III restriction enzyme, res subunit